MRPYSLVPALALALITAACGSDKNPVAPSTPTPTTTRVIRLQGSLNFGDVGLGQAPADQVVTVFNDGNANLTISGITSPCAGAAMTLVGSSSFAIAPGQSVATTFRFRPTTVQSCTGTVTYNSDATSGTNTVALTARGTLDGVPAFVRRGTGDDVFSLPSYVNRVNVTATYTGSCQNFIMRANGSSFINIIIGTCSVADTRSPFSGTYTVPAGATVSTVSSTGINWTVTEIR